MFHFEKKPTSDKRYPILVVNDSESANHLRPVVSLQMREDVIDWIIAAHNSHLKYLSDNPKPVSQSDIMD